MFPIVSDQLWTCRMCENLASAMEKGLDNCGVADCGSPLVQHCFEHYKGPLEGNLDRYCFTCGCDAEGTITIWDDPRKIGVCAKHCEEMFRRPESGFRNKE